MRLFKNFTNGRGLFLSFETNRERLPKSGARASAKVTLRLTGAELRTLDRFTHFSCVLAIVCLSTVI
jgi:hypothetical protein